MRSVSRKWLSGLLLSMALFFFVPQGTLAQGGGVLEGIVVNGTAGAPQVPSGMPVTLHVFRGDSEESSLETATDSQGRFRFEGLDTDSELRYSPEAVYQGVSYVSADGYQFGPDRTSLTAELTVFETTTDDSLIRLESVHMIAESFGSVLRLSEVHVFTNSGDRTFVGRSEEAAEGQQVTVVIPLPAGAVGLGFPDGESPDRYVQVEGDLKDTQPVRPGVETSIVRFSYHLVMDGPTLSSSREFAYPVSTLNVLAVEPGLTVVSTQLGAGESLSFEDRQYRVYQVQGLGPTTPLALEFVPNAEDSAMGGRTTPGTGAPSSGELVTGGNQAAIRWLGLGMVGLAVAGALAYPLLKRQTRS